ncbi:MAG TPA: hypothetical protein VMZ31_02430 [Phycisphaerae bacterium]|nr:hypothetical protein [Phycisphaerae bacterium]
MERIHRTTVEILRRIGAGDDLAAYAAGPREVKVGVAVRASTCVA